MAEHTTSETSSWLFFVDQVAAPLRLEPPERMRFGLMATLTVIAHQWGDIIFLRAAERLICEHSYGLEDFAAPAEDSRLNAWFADWLAAHAPCRSNPAPRLSDIVKPAWQNAQGENGAWR